MSKKLPITSCWMYELPVWVQEAMKGNPDCVIQLTGTIFARRVVGGDVKDAIVDLWSTTGQEIRPEDLR